MDSELSIPTFETFAQWYLWHLQTNLCASKEADQGATASELSTFFNSLYRDMFTRPSNYSILVEPYPDVERFNKKRLNVNRIVKKEIEFLYQLAKNGRLLGDSLQIEGSTYDDLSTLLAKSIRLGDFLEALKSVGLEINVGDSVTLTSRTIPGLPAGLHRLAQACSSDRIHGLFHFKRCNLRVLQADFSLQLDDLLQVLPGHLADGVKETDACITGNKFRRKIEPYGEFGYRITYNSKAGVIAYIHVNSFENETVYMYFRWVLDARQSKRLFERLDSTDPAFSIFLFDHVTKCDPTCVPGFGAATPEQCMACIPLEARGRTALACKDARYNQPSELSVDFSYMQKVTQLFGEILY